MPWWKLDDQSNRNPKIQALQRSALGNDLDGVCAYAMWNSAGAECLAKGSDGVVTEADLVSIYLNQAKVRKWAKRLVEAGLWHLPGHDCIRCPPADNGTWLFHDWFDAGKYRTAEFYKTQRRKSRESASATLRDQVWARDCIDNPADAKVGKCRYCGHEVRRSDRKSDRRPHVDHVDPDKADGLTNMVLSCHVCNQKKADKTPEEAGMTLLPPPSRTPEIRQIQPENQNQNQNTNQTKIKSEQPQNQELKVSPRVRERIEARRGEVKAVNRTTTKQNQNRQPNQRPTRKPTPAQPPKPRPPGGTP